MKFLHDLPIDPVADFAMRWPSKSRSNALTVTPTFTSGLAVGLVELPTLERAAPPYHGRAGGSARTTDFGCNRRALRRAS